MPLRSVSRLMLCECVPRHATATSVERSDKVADPIVTVGIPTYNRAPLLRGAIESVLSQTFHDFQLLVVDNASEDETKNKGARSVGELPHAAAPGVGFPEARQHPIGDVVGEPLAGQDRSGHPADRRGPRGHAREPAIGQIVGGILRVDGGGDFVQHPVLQVPANK